MQTVLFLVNRHLLIDNQRLLPKILCIANEYVKYWKYLTFIITNWAALLKSPIKGSNYYRLYDMKRICQRHVRNYGSVYKAYCLLILLNPNFNEFLSILHTTLEKINYKAIFDYPHVSEFPKRYMFRTFYNVIHKKYLTEKIKYYISCLATTGIYCYVNKNYQYEFIMGVGISRQDQKIHIRNNHFYKKNLFLDFVTQSNLPKHVENITDLYLEVFKKN